MSRARVTTLTFCYVFISSEAETLCRLLLPCCLRYFDNILVGHISGQVGVSHARRATLALFYFLYTPLNKFLSQFLCTQ